jgi:TPR repeat protein
MAGSTEVKQDLTKAAKYFDQASQMGDYDAAHALAFFYVTGYGGHRIDQRMSME